MELTCLRRFADCLSRRDIRHSDPAPQPRPFVHPEHIIRRQCLVTRLLALQKCGKATMYHNTIARDVSTLRGAYSPRIAIRCSHLAHHSARALWRHDPFHRNLLLLSWQILHLRSKLMDSTCDVSCRCACPYDAYLLMMRPNSSTTYMSFCSPLRCDCAIPGCTKSPLGVLYCLFQPLPNVHAFRAPGGGILHCLAWT